MSTENDSIPGTITIPTQESAGFTVPSHGADGLPLTMQQQFDRLIKNPKFVTEALNPDTPAAAWVNRMNQQAAGLDPDAPSTVPSAPDPGIYNLGNGPEVLTPEQEHADMQARGWLSAAGLSAQDGTSLAQYARERIGQLRDMSAEGWQAEGARTWAHLNQIYGPEAQAKLDKARQLVQHVEIQNPGLREFLEVSGLGNDALMTMRMIEIAEERGM